MSEITYAKIPTEALAIARQLTRSQFAVWTYLWEIDPFGNRLCDIPNPETIAKALGIHERTITRATERLEELNLFTFKINSWQAKNLFGTKAQKAENLITKKISIEQPDDLACCDKTIQDLTTRSKFGSNDPNLDQTIQKMTTRSQIGSDCQNRGSEIASEADSRGSHYYSLPIHDPLINIQEDFQKIREEETANNFQKKEETVEDIKTILKTVKPNLRSEKCKDEEFFQEDFSEKAQITEAINSENSEDANLETNSESQNKQKTNNLHPQNPNREATLNNQNLEVDQSSAAAPVKFFKNLREFVISEAKRDTAIKSPEIWANACLNRNPEEWQAKWDAWEKARSSTQTTTYTPPTVEISADPEVRRKATEAARKNLPAWMQAQLARNQSA